MILSVAGDGEQVEPMGGELRSMDDTDKGWDTSGWILDGMLVDPKDFAVFEEMVTEGSCVMDQIQPHIRIEDSQVGAKRKRKPKPRDRNIESCRKFRESRKIKLAQLNQQIKKMQDDRHIYLARIAELQMEAQLLRAGGTVDLGKENELLRAEIQKHKEFINSVVFQAQQRGMIPEEKVRLLETGVDSTVGQVLGLVYTSTDWKPSPTRVEIYDNIYADLKYQYLPLGSTADTAKRINLRWDFGETPVSVESMTDRLFMNAQRAKEIHSSIADVVGVDNHAETAEIHVDGTVEKLSPGTKFSLFSVSETGDNKESRKALVMSASKLVHDVYPHAYLPDFENNTPTTVSVVSQHTCKAKEYGFILDEKTIDCITLEDTLFSGQIVRAIPNKPNTCSVVSVSTFPVQQRCKSTGSNVLGCSKQFIDHDGNMTEGAKRMMRIKFEQMFADFVIKS
mmetsp:Transcript_34593/g.55271  ORF Transcript_34593/g.55271 Transcript_34593/m.55271 type:complete len:452 (+) Transcript_34593:163-1518(+)